MDDQGLALVYMVAGISSRFGGKIKQFAQIDSKGTTLIEKSLEQALPAGFTKIIFIVGNTTEAPFKEKFGDNFKGIPIEYALQKYDENIRDKPWGTTDALISAKELIKEPFVLVNGDDLYGEDTFKIISDHLKNSEEAATIGYNIMKVLPEEGTTNRGIFQIDNDYVQEIDETFDIEKLDLSKSGLTEASLCSMNIFGLQPQILETLQKILLGFKEENKEDRKAECLLPVELTKLIKEGLMKMKLYKTEDQWYGITNPGDEKIIQEALDEVQ